MSLTRYVGLLAGSTLGLAAAAFASSAEANNDTLAQIEALRKEVAQLKAANGDKWLTEERAKEIRAIVQDVLADADTRASLQSTGATAGYDKGFFIASPDGNFKLVVNGELQVRYAFSRLSTRSLHQLDPGTYQPPERGLQTEFPGGFENKGYQGFFGAGSTGSFERTARGFGVPRAKLAFSGHVVDPSWQYKIVGAFEQQNTQGAFREVVSAPGGFADFAGGSFGPVYASGTFAGNNSAGNGSLGSNFGLEDAFIRKVFDDNWSIKVGQFKSPFLREELVSSRHQLAVERSLVNQFFSTGYTQGVELTFVNDCFRVMASFNDGGNNANTASTIGNSSWGGNWTEYALTGRVEWKAMGSWDQFESMSSPNGSPTGLLIGAAVNWQRGGGADPPAYVDSWTVPGGTMGGIPLQPMNALQYPNNIPVNANDDVSNLTYTVDATVHFGGFSLYGAFVGNVAYGIPAGWVANPSGGFEGPNGNTPNNVSIVPSAWGGGEANRFVPGYGYGNSPIYSYGVVAQAGWFIVDDLELFGRYEFYTTINNGANGYAGNTPTFWGWIPGGSSPFANNTNNNGFDPGFPGPNAGINTPTDGYSGGQTNPYYAYNFGSNPYAAQMNNIITVGANWFPAGVKNQNIKITGDVSYAFQPMLFDYGIYGQGSAITDFRNDGGQGGGGQWVGRLQLQLFF